MKMMLQLIILIFYFSACTNDSVVDASKNLFSATIDGKVFVSKNSKGRIVADVDDTLQIVGSQDSGELVEVLFDDSKAKAGATIPCEGGCSVMVNNKLEAFTVETPGSVTISERSANRIKGKFTYNAIDDFITPTKTVKVSGEFDVELSKF